MNDVNMLDNKMISKLTKIFYTDFVGCCCNIIGGDTY